MKEFLEYVTRLLAEAPDQVEVAETVDGTNVTYELSVAPSDVGRIIGREGRVIRAIRGVLRAAGARQGLRVSLQVR
ncbi:MAG: KH domain-containing protein [Chloroflexi bacterium]|nr:KH domain-containing protein [Chloroflexota bacterium]